MAKKTSRVYVVSENPADLIMDGADEGLSIHVVRVLDRTVYVWAKSEARATEGAIRFLGVSARRLKPVEIVALAQESMAATV